MNECNPRRFFRKGMPAVIDARNCCMAEKIKNVTAVTIRAVPSDDKERVEESFK